MRFGFSGPRIGFFRPFVSFNVGGGRRNYRPPPQGAAPAADYVYVVTSSNGHVKIGISTDPEARLRTLQTGTSDQLQLTFTAPGYGNALTVEQEAHRILAAHRVSGEWFNVTPDLAVAAIFGAADRTGCSISNAAPSTSDSKPMSFLSKAMWFLLSITLFSYALQNDHFFWAIAAIISGALIITM